MRLVLATDRPAMWRTPIERFSTRHKRPILAGFGISNRRSEGTNNLTNSPRQLRHQPDHAVRLYHEIRPAECLGRGDNESRLFGVDTRKRDATASAAVLEALTPFFEDGVFQAPGCWHRSSDDR
jgi:hypothetical protein